VYRTINTESDYSGPRMCTGALCADCQLTPGRGVGECLACMSNLPVGRRAPRCRLHRYRGVGNASAKPKADTWQAARRERLHADDQGRSIVHFTAQRKQFVWDTLSGYQVSVTKTAQEELRSG